MAAGVNGPNGANAQKVVVLVIKPEIGFATALRQLMVETIVLPMDPLTWTLECASRKVAQVCC